ncbi:MAG TPA: aminotransferase class V-fold PLP-dependent enzyme [Longimicrobiales bacterium]|nr:aminotransferase class V-fold PLP-dependent enzyme [Longimicrobiales bacterium]
MLDCQRHLFDLPAGLHYLNCAYMSPLPRAVEQAGIQGIRRKLDPSGISVADFFRDSDTVRERFGRLVGCEPARVALIPAVSYGMALVARALRPERGGNIVLAGEQFPSNVYAWRSLAARDALELRTVARSRDAGAGWTERVLACIDSATELVALPQAHWTDGSLFDLERFGARARQVGALFVVDGTQTVGAHPFDVRAVRPDALVCAGYKWLLGPYSLGVMYLGERFDDAQPLEETWIGREASEDFRALVDYRDRYRQDASRFDVGERSNFILVPMLAAALEQLLEWGVAEVAAYCDRLNQRVARGAAELGYQPVGGERCANIVGVRAPVQADDALLDRLLAERRVFVSRRGDALRVSPHVYNDDADVDALLEVLRAAL